MLIHWPVLIHWDVSTRWDGNGNDLEEVGGKHSGMDIFICHIIYMQEILKE